MILFHFFFLIKATITIILNSPYPKFITKYFLYNKHSWLKQNANKLIASEHSHYSGAFLLNDILLTSFK